MMRLIGYEYFDNNENMVEDKLSFVKINVRFE